jgi:hypothetical protein
MRMPQASAAATGLAGLPLSAELYHAPERTAPGTSVAFSGLEFGKNVLAFGIIFLIRNERPLAQ